MEPLWVPDLHPRSRKHPPQVPDGGQINLFLIVKIEKSVIHQFVSILQDKSIGQSKYCMDIIFGVWDVLHVSGRLEQEPF